MVTDGRVSSHKIVASEDILELQAHLKLELSIDKKKKKHDKRKAEYKLSEKWLEQSTLKDKERKEKAQNRKEKTAAAALIRPEDETAAKRRPPAPEPQPPEAAAEEEENAPPPEQMELIAPPMHKIPHK
ncbi:hypothetical protein D4764_04G0000880 [Takifugu flavidus]|uniref:Uncharacterized protein n=1 Tax=Takifugu flavidus TaxID=433684 RepID=A0A5C6N554_9TELE|nr:hypothetical protein D4764_04G0000880 [Takifugu flavidus]